MAPTYTIAEPFGNFTLRSVIEESLVGMGWRADRNVHWWLKHGECKEEGYPESTFIELTPKELGFTREPTLVELAGPHMRAEASRRLLKNGQQLGNCASEDFISRVYVRAAEPQGKILTAAMMPMFVHGPFNLLRHIVLRADWKRKRIIGVPIQRIETLPLWEPFLFRVCPADEIIKLPVRMPAATEHVSLARIS